MYEDVRKELCALYDKYSNEEDLMKSLAIGHAIIALDDREFYRIHDLTRNPNDLPAKNGNDESEEVFVLIKISNYKHWDQGYYKFDKDRWSVKDSDYVTAWMRIPWN